MKRLLTIKAASDVCSDEIKHLEAIAGMFGIEHEGMELDDMSSFTSELETKKAFDFVYLGAHANTEFFGESDGSKIFHWHELASCFCGTESLNPGSVLLLGCCRGGLKNVALDLFCACDRIDYICGPRWTVTGADISAGFHIFIYNYVIRREQPSKAVKRASKGTGYDFFCHDRVEMQDYLNEYCYGNQET